MLAGDRDWRDRDLPCHTPALPLNRHSTSRQAGLQVEGTRRRDDVKGGATLMGQLVTSIPTLHPGERLLCGPGPSNVNPKVLEGLFAADLAYLQDFYNRINSVQSRKIAVACPQCQHGFELEPELAGGS